MSRPVDYLPRLYLLTMSFQLALSSLYCLCNDHHNCLLLSKWNGSSGVFDPQKTNLTLTQLKSDGYFKSLVAMEKLPREKLRVGSLGVCRLRKANEGLCYKAMAVTKKPEEPDKGTVKMELTFGCLSEISSGLLACRSHLPPTRGYAKTIACCNEPHLCNVALHLTFPHHFNASDAIRSAELHSFPQNAFPPFTTNIPNHRRGLTPGRQNENKKFPYIFFIVSVTIFIVVLLVAMFLLVRCTFQRRKRQLSRSPPMAPSICCSCYYFLCRHIFSRQEDHPPQHRRHYPPRNHLLSLVSTESPNSEHIPPPSTCSQRPLVTSRQPPHSISQQTPNPIYFSSLHANSIPSSSLAVSSPIAAGPSWTTNSTNLSSVDVAPFIQRTVSQQVSLSEKIGEGRFSSVYLGELYADEVAVRVFPPSNYESERYWMQEVKMMQSAQLTHEHVTHILGADQLIWPDDGTSRRILILPYYPLRDLRYFCLHLTETSSNIREGIRPLDKLLHLMIGIVSGLTYLHSDISGSRGKPPIAHRNLKLSNVYVTLSGTQQYSACIGDFGLSIVYQSMEQGQSSFNTTQSGHQSGYTPLTQSIATSSLSSPVPHTPQITASTSVTTMDTSVLPTGRTDEFDSWNPYRSMESSSCQPPWFPLPGGNILVTDPDYAAPEILDNTLQVNAFDSFLKADLYALGVVLWRLVRWWLHKFHISDKNTNDKIDLRAGPSLIDCIPPYWSIHLSDMREDNVASSDSPFPNLLTEEEKNLLEKTSSSFLTLSPTVSKLEEIFRECTLQQPALRLSALRVKKSITALVHELHPNFLSV